MKLILLIPIIIYLCLMLVNIPLLRDFQTLNIFWATSIEMPIIMFSSFFIVLYAVFVYIIYSWVNSYLHHKNKKLERTIVELKATLYDNQKDLLTKISTEHNDQIATFKKDNDHKFETLIRYNEYTLEKVIEETNGSFSKYRKETQKLLANTKWVDKGIFEKLKVWK